MDRTRDERPEGHAAESRREGEVGVRSRTPTHAFRGFDIPIDLMGLTGGGPETFDAIAEGHLRNVEWYAGLAPDHSVLEIGCGIGRDAIPLTAKLSPSGRYLGVDIVAPSIRWCTANITSRHPNFRFVQFDVQDELHNPEGTRGARDFTVPLDNRSIDRIIVQSVFTHLLAPEVSHYLKEFHRVLKDDGRVYATFFVYDDAVLEKARDTNLTPFDLRFEHEVEPGAASTIRRILWGRWPTRGIGSTRCSGSAVFDSRETSSRARGPDTTSIAKMARTSPSSPESTRPEHAASRARVHAEPQDYRKRPLEASNRASPRGPRSIRAACVSGGRAGTVAADAGHCPSTSGE